jgi:hypothetical protein
MDTTMQGDVEGGLTPNVGRLPPWRGPRLRSLVGWIFALWIPLAAGSMLCAPSPCQLPVHDAGPGLAVRVALRGCETHGGSPTSLSREISYVSMSPEPLVSVSVDGGKSHNVGVAGRVSGLVAVSGGGAVVCGQCSDGRGFVDVLQPVTGGDVVRTSSFILEKPVVAAFYSWVDGNLYMQDAAMKVVVVPVVLAYDRVCLGWANMEEVGKFTVREAQGARLCPGGGLRLGYWMSVPGSVIKVWPIASKESVIAVAPRVAFSPDRHAEAVMGVRQLRVRADEELGMLAKAATLVEVGTGRVLGAGESASSPELSIRAGRIYMSRANREVVCAVHVAHNAWGGGVWQSASIFTARALGAHLFVLDPKDSLAGEECLWIVSVTRHVAPRVEGGILAASHQVPVAKWLGRGVALWACGGRGDRMWVQALRLSGDKLLAASEVVGVDVERQIEGGAFSDVVMTGEFQEVSKIDEALPVDRVLVDRLARIRAASALDLPK